MNEYKFISSKSIIKQFKSSKLFKTDLGKSFLNDSNGEIKADLSRQEKFVKYYFKENNSAMLFKEGNIGSIEFYSDPKILTDVLIYLDDKHFVFSHSFNIMREKGIEKYLGGMIKEIETNHINGNKIVEHKNIDIERDLTEQERILQAEHKLNTNPGMVTYDDIKHLLKNKRRI